MKIASNCPRAQDKARSPSPKTTRQGPTWTRSLDGRRFRSQKTHKNLSTAAEPTRPDSPGSRTRSRTNQAYPMHRQLHRQNSHHIQDSHILNASHTQVWPATLRTPTVLAVPARARATSTQLIARGPHALSSTYKQRETTPQDRLPCPHEHKERSKDPQQTTPNRPCNRHALRPGHATPRHSGRIQTETNQSIRAGCTFAQSRRRYNRRACGPRERTPA